LLFVFCRDYSPEKSDTESMPAAATGGPSWEIANRADQDHIRSSGFENIIWQKRIGFGKLEMPGT